MKYQLNGYSFTVKMNSGKCDKARGKLIARLPFFLAQESWSVQYVRLCLFHTHKKKSLFAELSLTASIAVALLGIFIQMNTVTVYYTNLNCKNKFFSYKYHCIK